MYLVLNYHSFSIFFKPYTGTLIIDLWTKAWNLRLSWWLANQAVMVLLFCFQQILIYIHIYILFDWSCTCSCLFSCLFVPIVMVCCRTVLSRDICVSWIAFGCQLFLLDLQSLFSFLSSSDIFFFPYLVDGPMSVLVFVFIYFLFNSLFVFIFLPPGQTPCLWLSKCPEPDTTEYGKLLNLPDTTEYGKLLNLPEITEYGKLLNLPNTTEHGKLLN